MSSALSTEVPRLRSALRDLVALSTIPAAWVGRDPPAIAAGLADVLVGSLHLDFAFVRLCDPNGGAAVEVTRGNASRTFPEWLHRRLAAGTFPRKEIVSNLGNAEAGRGIVIPIGVAAEGGLVAAASDRADFPAEIDQLLLSVAANHATTAFQNARLIHERKKAEERLRQTRDELELKVAERTAELQESVDETMLMLRNLSRSEARLADAQRTAHVAYWERDLDSGELTCSDEGFRIVGLTPHERPMSAAEVRARIHPDDLPAQTRALAEAIAGGARYDMEYRIVRPTGEVRIVHSQGDAVRDESGRPRRMVGILQDITERRGAEYLTRHVFKTLPDGICVIGRDYRYRQVNPVYEHYFKMPADRIVGTHVVEHAGERMFEQSIKPRLDRCFAGEQASYAEWVDGVAGHRYLSMLYSPLRSMGSGEVDTALVITRDLTEYMLASERLQEAQAELARVTRVTMLGEITASIAHEVNQPLAAVVMNGNACRRWLAADPPNLAEARDAAQRVVSDGERAGKIMARIRTLVRRGMPERHVLDINDVIREALSFTRAELERQDIEIQTRLGEGLPAILGDRVQLQQVLVNLALNACDAMADMSGGLRQLTVTSRREESGGVLVAVKDSGQGIDAGAADRMFEAFFSTKSGGLGMGLTISRSIVEMHGGKIWAASNDEHPGATIHFALPAAPASRGQE